METAIAIWSDIAASPGLESRHYLQAWTFLRQAGHPPPTDGAKRALGVVAEMPVQNAHDVLAAYQDGSCRFGQGPQQPMMADPAASSFVGAATALLQIVVNLTVQ